MAAEVKEQTLGLAEAPTCQHHWVVDAPAGAESRGVCRKCGAIKGFRNATQDFVWEEERSADLGFLVAQQCSQGVGGGGERRLTAWGPPRDAPTRLGNPPGFV